ncbi:MULTISPECIES: hypothetical protein [Lysobacter]|uniref:hypothetical protein n=1 Tax=Lysobacter TaxID=68 RepID=UPI001F327478|nr:MULTISPECIES: hypothetical protein [Lysobacter]UJB17600.1 hypothetical protein L1A79_14610 [Lysobacter capsici]UJQ28678.1 hypothetical protein L2D09_00260 [Lysobacter gummosus]
MDILILVLAGLAFFHFVYEGIWAPSARMELRNEMFGLRDELRKMRIARDKPCSKEAFDIAHDGVNQYLNRLHWVTISFERRYSRALKDREFRNVVKKRAAILHDADNEQLKSVAHRANGIIEKAFFTNSGGWLPYLLTLAVIAILVNSIRSKFSKRIDRRASQVLATPEARIEKLRARAIMA